MNECVIDTEFIKLDQFLKFENLVESGGMAKLAISDGLIKVNGVVEIARGKKLRNGDQIEFDGETYVIRPGDTLYQISLNRYGTVAAMEQICALNGISANEIIYPGQVIVLP